jgi:hypothetical protein
MPAPAHSARVKDRSASAIAEADDSPAFTNDAVQASKKKQSDAR